MASKPTVSFFDPIESPTQAPRPGGRRQPSNRSNRPQQTKGKKRRDSNGHDDNNSKMNMLGAKYSPYARPRRSKRLVVVWMAVFVFILVVTYYLNRRQRAMNLVAEPLAEGILMHDEGDQVGGRIGVSEALRNKVRPPKAPPVFYDEQ
ncbi:hypothetical protein PG985_009061 [Apiospora marii]|uniref:Transmembrane protein n=1 Tax=Apiospora marii TaxID=335849 RepID=A0ABR1RAP6_9PEZI